MTPESKKPNPEDWAFAELLVPAAGCRLPVSNWPPDNYKFFGFQKLCT
jgi:hypothetical protein